MGALIDAHATGAPLSPPTTTFSDRSVVDASAVQRVQLRAWTTGEARIKRDKAGLTSAKTERRPVVDAPGMPLDTMPVPENAAIGAGRFLWSRVTPGTDGGVLESWHGVLSGSIAASVPVAQGKAGAAAFAGMGSVTAPFGEEKPWAS